ncbi:hypothetical protein EYF80_002237 [Liparis tanakae]|uniref:Uncharacterized protein n=1 Tax=Liparis tanakae TaxID=230148 RepID=A0A4Z2JBK5_9TELE|nr:hypothetical protein EYF80_002237 [Liparis tanakae]
MRSVVYEHFIGTGTTLDTDIFTLMPPPYLVLMESLHRGPQRRHMVRQGLVVRRQVLGQWGT